MSRRRRDKYTDEQIAAFPYDIYKGAYKGARAMIPMGHHNFNWNQQCTVLFPDGTTRQLHVSRASIRRDYFPNAITD